MRLQDDLRISRAPAAAFWVVGLFWGTFAAYVPVIKPQAGLSDGAFGLALLFSALGTVCAMWLAPKFDARLGRRSMPMFAVALALAFLLPGVAVNWWTFAAAMMLAAAASGALDIIMNARVSALEGAQNRPLMNLNHAVFSFGYAFAAICAGVAREAGAPPIVAFGTMTVFSLAMLVEIRRDPGGETSNDETRTAQGRVPVGIMIPAGLLVLVGFMAEQGTEGWSALHLERNLGAGAAEGAFGPALLGLTMAAGRLSGQIVATRFSESRVLWCAACLSAMGAVAAAYAPTLAIAYLGFGVLGLGVSVVAPMGFAWVGRLVPTGQRTHAISRVATLGYCGFFIGPPMMGGAAQLFGLRGSFTLLAVLLMLIPLVFIPLLKRATPVR